MHLAPLNLLTSPIRPWLSADPAGQKFLPTYLSDDWEPQMDPKKNFLWIVEEEGKEVGFFDFELDPSGAGYFVFYVAPEFRGRGLARKILEAGLETPQAKSCAYWEAGVEVDNATSRRVLESAGFENRGPDEDGMLMYRRENLRE